jgi:hypothetical protein
MDPMTTRTPRGEMLAPRATQELTTTLTAAEIDERVAADIRDGGTGSLTLTGVSWKIFDQIHLIDGIVLTTADGVTYLGHLEDDDEAHAELTIDLM